MSKKKAKKPVQQINTESRETCTCPICEKRAMDILGGETVELKCPNCGRFVPIPFDKEKRSLKVAEGKHAHGVFKDGKL